MAIAVGDGEMATQTFRRFRLVTRSNVSQPLGNVEVVRYDLLDIMIVSKCRRNRLSQFSARLCEQSSYN
jgi:hypothetical protein